jgi:VanZ family protein
MLDFHVASRPQFWDDVPDWFSHAVVYLVLSFLVSRALAGGRPLGVRLGVCVFAFCVLYGVSDEWHQSFVPGRQSDPWDVVKDAAGTLIGLGVYRAWPRRPDSREERVA